VVTKVEVLTQVVGGAQKRGCIANVPPRCCCPLLSLPGAPLAAPWHLQKLSQGLCNLWLRLHGQAEAQPSQPRAAEGMGAKDRESFAGAVS
jgi:hypothetical protein